MDSLHESRYNVIITLLEKNAKREGIINPSVELIKGCEKGDGYVGEKSIAIVKGDNKSMEYFIKAAPTDPAFKKALDLRPIYLLEILFYENVIPTFKEFQTRKEIPRPFTSVIGCVDTCSEKGNELLILENAKKLGFELWDRKKQMNREHVEFVYTEYGKFHGLSYALKNQEPKVYQSLINGMEIDIYKYLADNLLQSFINIAETSKAQLDQIKEAKLYNAYTKMIASMPNFFQKLQNEKDKYSVIVHGDCWCTNIMFKYAPNSKKSCPEKMCLLDFQTIGQGPPILDLSYFTYASAPKEVYNNLDYYLKIYHDSLSRTVRDLGSIENAIPTFEELKDLWKLYGKYGVLFSVIALKVCVQDQDETQDISEVLKENGGTDIFAGFAKKGKNDDLYHERLRSIIIHAVENEFI